MRPIRPGALNRLTCLRSPLALALALAAATIVSCSEPPVASTKKQKFESIAAALEAKPDANDGFARVLAPRPFRFPEDHGPHPDHRTEWWYFTGHLEAEGGRYFGFQLTFFRTALTPTRPARASAWAAQSTWMAHFAVTDSAGKVHHARERFARGALGLAGAQAAPFNVHIGDWRAASRGDDLFPWNLVAKIDDEDCKLDFSITVKPKKPIVFQGDEGFSVKSADAGNASYYHSYTRLDARGTLKLDGQSLAVRGEAWMDHEWSTSALGSDLLGWDWFAIQLEDGRELMVYLMRRRDGSYGEASSGSLIDAQGRKTSLSMKDFELKKEARWTSPQTGITYPSSWTLRVPQAKLELSLKPVIPDQEMRLAVVYYEGALRVSGKSKGKAVKGRGFVELVGYGDDRATDTREE